MLYIQNCLVLTRDAVEAFFIFLLSCVLNVVALEWALLLRRVDEPRKALTMVSPALQPIAWQWVALQAKQSAVYHGHDGEITKPKTT